MSMIHRYARLYLRRHPQRFPLGLWVIGWKQHCGNILSLWNDFAQKCKILQIWKMPVGVVSNPSWAPLQTPAWQIGRFICCGSWRCCPNTLAHIWAAERAKKWVVSRANTTASWTYALSVQTDIGVQAFIAARVRRWCLHWTFSSTCCCCLCASVLAKVALLLTT